MNLLVRIILIALLSALAQWFFPWWTALVVALLVELLFGKSSSLSFFSGFYGVAISWIILATYLDLNNDSVLSERILALFKLPTYSFVMIILTGLIGGVVGGVGSLTGSWIKGVFVQEDGK